MSTWKKQNRFQLNEYLGTYFKNGDYENINN